MSSTPTLKDIAERMGISQAAVSLGLRHAGNISEATCKRIAEVAREMGYRPNPHAAALSTKLRQGDAKGVPLAILQRPLKGGAALYPIQSIVDGIMERSNELGYRTECFPVLKNSELPRLLKLLYNRGFLGIFMPPIGKDFQARDFDWTHFSVVGCGRYDQTSIFHTVRQEIFESTRFMLDEIIARGYRRICMGLLKHDPPILDDFARVAVAQVSLPGGWPTEVFFSQPASDLSDFVKWVHAKKADAVVGFSLAHYYALVDSGVRIPKDMGFATLHQWFETNGTEVSGLSPLENHCGIVAANRMDAMIRHHERGIPAVAEQIVIRSNWHSGTTLPIRKKSQQSRSSFSK